MDGWKVLEEKRFVIPSLPPSVNAIYQILFNQRRVEMKPEVRAWKNSAKLFIPKMTAMEETNLFEIDFKFYLPFFYKNGNLKKIDTQNLMKVLIDAIAEKNGFCDSVVKFGSWETYDSETEKVEVKICQVTNEN